MNQQERLTDLLKQADEHSASRCITDYDEATADNAAFLLENGVIVSPCNPGDMLYQPFEGKILEYKVLSWSVRMDGLVVTTHSQQTGGLHTIWGHCIGETHFLTRAEAEKALTERSEP